MNREGHPSFNKVVNEWTKAQRRSRRVLPDDLQEQQI